MPALLDLAWRTRSPFVGRESHLEMAGDCLRGALTGDPAVLLVQGDAGIGKTRFLREVVARAERLGLQTCYGRSSEDPEAHYQPFLAEFLPRIEDAGLLAPGSGSTDLSALSSLTGRTPASGTGNSPDEAPPSASSQVTLGLARSALLLAGIRPLALVLDDLQWADADTLEVILRLVLAVTDEAARRPVPICVVLAAREVPEGHPLTRVLDRLKREDVVHTFALPALTAVDVNELVRRLFDAPCAPGLLTSLVSVTGGNPLFVMETLRYLESQGALEQRGGALTSTGTAEVRLPSGVTTAIRDRLTSLEPSARDAISVGAFLGEEVTLELLLELSGLPESDAGRAIDDAARLGFVEESPAGFRFTHAAVRQVFYELLGPALRARMHLRIAGILVARAEGGAPSLPIQVARHLAAAGPLADPLEAGRWALRAAEQAIGVFAWGEAARAYEAALSNEAFRKSASPGDLSRLLCSAGFAHYRNLDIEQGRARYSQAIDACRASDDLLGWAEALVGVIRVGLVYGTGPGGQLDTSAFQEFFAAAQDREPRARARVMCYWAEILWSSGQSGEARRLAKEALEVASETRDDYLAAHANVALGLAHFQDLDLEDSLQAFQESLVAANRLGDPWVQGWARVRIPLVLICQGRLVEAEAAAAQAVSHALEIQNWTDLALGYGCQAAVAVLRGDFDAGERLARQALGMVHRVWYPWAPPVFFPALARARMLRGAWSEARDALQLWGAEQQLTTIAIMGQLVRALSGDAAGLQAETEANPRRFFWRQSPDALNLGTIVTMVEIAVAAGVSPLADLHAEALKQTVAKGVVFSLTPACLVSRALGEAAALGHDWVAAVEYFREAVTLAREAGARPELALTLVAAAEALKARGEPGDARRAGEFLHEAEAIASDLGMTPTLERARALLGRTAATPREAGETRLTPTELNFVFFLAEGRPLPEVARLLLMHERTVADGLRRLAETAGVTDPQSARRFLEEHRITAPGALARRGIRSPRSTAPTRKGPLRFVLVSDIERSTELNSLLGDVPWVDLLSQHNAIVRACLAAHEGNEVKHTGDGLFAVFDSPAQAVACGLDITSRFPLASLTDASVTVNVCIGITAGEPVETDDDLFGLSVTKAFRMSSRAKPGEVLVTDALRALARGDGFRFTYRGMFALKGFKDRERLFEVSRA